MRDKERELLVLTLKSNEQKNDWVGIQSWSETGLFKNYIKEDWAGTGLF